MHALKLILSLLLLLPLGSCSYFWLVHYPHEVQRDTRGSYSVIAHSAPTGFLSPELVLGSLHNNTAIDVSLVHGGEVLTQSRLLAREDRPAYHLPLKVTWLSNTVTVADRDSKHAIIFEVPRDGI